MSARRSWNVPIWAGFAVTLAAPFSYIFFLRFPSTRDLPWVTLLLFLAGGCLLAIGLRNAFRRPERYRGKVAGIVCSVLGVSLCGFFCWGVVVLSRRVPSSGGAPRVGQQAPDFTLADATGKSVSLSDLRRTNRAVLLIFYRGYW